MHYDRWRDQWVGQATDVASSSDMSAADQALFNQMMQAGTSSAAAPATASTAISPTTLVVGGVLALGLLWFLTKR